MPVDEREAWLPEAQAEVRRDDPVAGMVTLHRFVSRSKGLRNGRQRPRRRWKEVYLLRYLRGGYRQSHRFPFDVYATEVLGPRGDEMKLRERIAQANGLSYLP